jgi:hypothetical protein
MVDIATLGLAVDSSQVDKGKISLDQLSNSAKRAQSAANGVSASTKNAGSAAVSLSASAGRAAASLNSEAAAAQKAATAMRAHAQAVNDNVNRMSGSMSGLAAQFQDIGVTAAMGMNPLIIGLQQGTQIAGQMEMAMQGGSSAAGVLGNAFRSLLQPLTFLSIGLTALAALGLQFVDWPAAAAMAINALAWAVEHLTPYIIGLSAAMALIYAPAILSGIAAATVAVGTLGATALRAAAAFTTAWLAAIGPAGWFILGLAAVSTAAVVFRDELAEIFGRDIVADAKNGVNAVIGAFVGGYNGIVAAWDNLPAAMGDLAIRAGNAFLEGLRRMLQTAVTQINIFIRGISQTFAGTPLEAFTKNLPTIDNSGGKDGPFARSKWQMGNPHAGAASDVGGIVSDAIQAAQGKDYLGELGGAISRGASAAAGKLRELAFGIGATDEASKKAASSAEKLANKYDNILRDAEGFIAAQMAERDALLLTEEAANALRYEQELLNRAMQAGIPIDATKATEIKSYAAAMAGAEAETSRFREALDFAKDVSKGFMSDLRSGLEQGKGFFRSFADAALNALDKVVDKLLNDVIDAIFQVNSAGSSGGGLFGFLGNLFGGGGISPLASGFLASGGAGLFANGAAFRAGNVIPFATGGVVSSATTFPMSGGRTGLMGEAGPEAIMPLKRGPDGKLGVQAGGGGSQPVQINYNPVYNVAQGADPKAIAELRKAQEADRKQFTAKVSASIRELNKRNVRF